jgi:hypothetical protein
VFAETMEMSTYYPAATNITNVDRFHANRESVGNAYNPTNVPDGNLPDGYLVVANRVGIGLANPAMRLEVRDSAGGTVSRFYSDAAGVNQGLAITTNLAAPFVTTLVSGGTNAGDLAFSTAAGAAVTERMRLQAATGNFGIATNNPTSSLSLGGEAVRTISMERRTGNNADGLGLLVRAGGGSAGGNNRTGGTISISGGIATGNGSSSVVFQTATAGAGGNADRIPTTKMTILGNGNVGINTGAPGARLDVAEATAGVFAIRGINTAASSNGIFGQGTSIAIQAQGGTLGVVSTGTTGGAQFTGSGANSYGLFSQGQLYGTYSQGNQSLNSYGVVAIGGLIGAYGTANRPTSYGGYFTGTTHGVFAQSTGAAGTIGIRAAGRNGALIVGSNGYGVQGSGTTFDFYATGAGINYGAPSSLRWKRNVRSIDNALLKINQLRGVYFDWDPSHGGAHDLGVVAEEVGKVFPEIVAYDPNGVDVDAVDYTKLAPALIEAVKELSRKVDALEAEVKTLKEEKARGRK